MNEWDTCLKSQSASYILDALSILCERTEKTVDVTSLIDEIFHNACPLLKHQRKGDGSDICKEEILYLLYTLKYRLVNSVEAMIEQKLLDGVNVEEGLRNIKLPLIFIHIKQRYDTICSQRSQKKSLLRAQQVSIERRNKAAVKILFRWKLYLTRRKVINIYTHAELPFPLYSCI